MDSRLVVMMVAVGVAVIAVGIRALRAPRQREERQVGAFLLLAGFIVLGRVISELVA